MAEAVTNIKEYIAQKKSQRMSEEEFATAVGVCPKTLYRLRKIGKIQYRKVGRRIFYLPEDIEAFNNGCLNKPKH